MVNTWSIITVSDSRGTIGLSCRVYESVDAALRHVNAMNELSPVEPVYVAGNGGRRWTWEYTNASGMRCVDTVRIF